MIARTVIRLVAATLPPTIRARYREEWLSDADGAAELGISPGGVAVGAVTTAITLDRDDPVIAGMSSSQLAAHRLRWSAAMLTAALVLGLGATLWGVGSPIGLEPDAPLTQVATAAIIGSILIALVAGAIVMGGMSLGAAVDAHGVRGILARLGGAAAVIAVSAIGMLSVITVLAGAAAIAALVVVAIVTTRAPARPIGWRRHLALTLPVALIAPAAPRCRSGVDLGLESAR